MELELKHIKGYFPYLLRGVKNNESTDIYTLLSYNRESIWWNLNDSDEWSLSIKPILRPLSDIGESIYYKLWSHETDYESILQFMESDYETIKTYKFSLDFWESLYEHHFDIHGLIETGLAIDINTLK